MKASEPRAGKPTSGPEAAIVDPSGGFAASPRAALSPYGTRVTEVVAGRVETRFYELILDAQARAAMYGGNPVVQP